MTFPSSLKSGCVKALASFTASLMPLIPVLMIFFKFYAWMDSESRGSVQENFRHRLNTDEHGFGFNSGAMCLCSIHVSSVAKNVFWLLQYRGQFGFLIFQTRKTFF